jgi:hypothetical protein
VSALTALRLAALCLHAEPSDAGVTLEIEEFAAEPSDAGAPVEAPVTRLFGSARGQLAIGVRPDAQPDPNNALARNLFETLWRANLGADVKLSPSVRVMLEGRFWWRGTTEPDFQHSKASLDPRVGDAFIDFYTSRVDVRVGNQVVSFGANPLLAPADQLNPRDFRMSFLQSEPEDVKLPAPAIRATGDIGKVSWTAAYFPFFTPDLYDVFGTNASLLQPTAVASLPVTVSSSIVDQLQPRLLETTRPNAWPWLGDLGLRATTQAGPVKLGASWVWMNEKLPEPTLDPQLAALLSSQLHGVPPDPAALLSVEGRLLAGQQLYNGFYQRQHLFSAEASALVGTAQLSADLTYSPAQTFIDGNLNPVRKPSITWVLGLSQASDSSFIYAFNYVGLAVPGIDAQQLLLLIEPASAQGAARIAWLHVFMGTVSQKLVDGHLELSLRAAFEPVLVSGAVAPRVTWNFRDRYHLWAGAELYQGKSLSPFGYFNRANSLLVGAAADLF